MSFVENDKNWKSHKTNCKTCSTAPSLDECCKEGRRLYKIRLDSPDAAVKSNVIPGKQ